MSEIPRRIQMLQWCEAEHTIQRAVDDVERMGADERLTDAVVLLAAARDRVADFVDGVPGKRTVPGAVAAAGASHEPTEAMIAAAIAVVIELENVTLPRRDEAVKILRAALRAAAPRDARPESAPG